MIKAEMRKEFKLNDYNFKYVKSLFVPVINHLLRNFSICNSHNQIVSSLGKDEYRELFESVSAPSSNVKSIVETFLKKVIDFQKFLRTCKFRSRHSSRGRYRYIKIYLHKIYRIAPVFDYNRAKQNLKILHKHLDLRHFWPRITTQIAIVIYVTDKKKNKYNKNLLQKNIRAITSCSAYAFHRTRNFLHII